MKKKLRTAGLLLFPAALVALVAVLVFDPHAEWKTGVPPPAHTFEVDEWTGTMEPIPPDGSRQDIPIPLSGELETFALDPVFKLPGSTIDITEPPYFVFDAEPSRGCWTTTQDISEVDEDAWEWECSEGCALVGDGCNVCCDNPKERTKTCTVHVCEEERDE